MKKTTTIKINGERWKVPSGFGAAYKREAAKQFADTLKPGKVIDVVVDIMTLVGYGPTREAVIDWPLRKRVEAIVYCATEYLRASDNPVQRHPRLKWLPEPWKGPPADVDRIRADIRGAFAGPTPTEIPA